MKIKIILMYVSMFTLISFSVGSSVQYQLNITVWPNEPYIYEKDGKYDGILIHVLESFNAYHKTRCGPKGLLINYGPNVGSHSELLNMIIADRSPTSSSNILAFGPVMPTELNHTVFSKYEVVTILFSSGFTLVASSVTQTKMYRLVNFGFTDSVTLLVILILATICVGSVVWFLVCNKLHYITLHYITLHYITLHYITLHYITLHYITLHYITLHYITLHYITLHYITLHYITLHYITLHYITLHYITLHYITLHYITLHYITLHYITLHYITLHYITLHYITLHYITLHNITLHYIALLYITFNCIALHYITLHCIALHYITLHYITLHI